MARSVFNPKFRTDYPEYKPNQVLYDDEGNCWRYVQVRSGISQHAVVVIDETGEARGITRALAEIGDRVGVAVDSFTAPPAVPAGGRTWGWVSVMGQGDISVLALAPRGVPLYATAGSDGFLDDAASANKKIAGLGLTATRGAGNGTTAAIWTHPVVAS